MSVSFVAGTMNGLTTSGDTNTTSAINSTGANVGLASFYTTQSQPISTVSDSKSNTWTAAGGIFPFAYGSNTFYFYLYYSLLTSVGTNHTLTITNGGGNALSVVGFVVFSGGVSSGSPFDGTPTGNFDSGYVQSHPTTTLSLTTSNPGSALVLFGTTQNSASETFTAGVPGTTGASAAGSGSTYNTQFMAYTNDVSPSTYDASWTTANYDDAGTFLLAISAPQIYQPFTQTQIFRKRKVVVI